MKSAAGTPTIGLVVHPSKSGAGTDADTRFGFNDLVLARSRGDRVRLIPPELRRRAIDDDLDRSR